MSTAHIASIASVVPEHAYTQTELAETLLHLIKLEPDQVERFRRMAAGSGIQTRYSALPDYRLDAQRQLYPDSPDFEPVPNLEARMDFYHQAAVPLAVRAIEKALESLPIGLQQVTHLITVSCTGLAAPGLDLMLLKELELRPDTHRSSVNFMGCYAAVHGLKQADAICRSDPRAIVVVVCVELCTLHFQKDANPDNLAASLLFADGAAAAVLTGEQITLQAPSLQLKGFYSQVALHGWQDMAWQLSGTGFLMKLSAYIPQLLQQGIKGLVQQALLRLGLEHSQIDHWALHPGGRKILDLAQQELDLPENALKASYDVLRDYGNMSSPTILFVLAQLWSEFQTGQHVFAAAFGPGLTMETFTAHVG